MAGLWVRPRANHRTEQLKGFFSGRLRNKRSSLLRTHLNYGRKIFTTLDPLALIHTIIVTLF